MRYRAAISCALFAAFAACGETREVATEPLALEISKDESSRGVKPPPPRSSDQTSISISSPSSETEDDFFLDQVSATQNAPFFALVLGRYFANTQSTNGWIDFESSEDVIASPNARLQYNEKTGKTTGRGTLTRMPLGIVLDLSKITIITGEFGACPPPFSEQPCATATFEYDGIPGGSLEVFPSAPIS